MSKIRIGSRSGGVGDNIVFTCLFDVADIIFEMVDHPKSRNVAQLFDDMCEVVFVENPVQCAENTSRSRHIAQKKLDGLGLSHLTNAIPRINYKRFYDEYKSSAEDFLSKYHSPIAFVSDNNGNHANGDNAARYRVPEKEKLQWIINKLTDAGHTIIQFGLSNKTSHFTNTVELLDLSIKELAVYYSLIGRYVGIDTGDYHLMLSVGGFANVFVPPSNGWYNHSEWHYTDELWGGEPKRVKYIPFLGIEGCNILL